MIDDLIKKMGDLEKYIQSLDGSKYDSKQDNTVIPSPILHQSSENMSEEQSAKFERDNPEMTRLLQSIKQSINNILR